MHRFALFFALGFYQFFAVANDTTKNLNTPLKFTFAQLAAPTLFTVSGLALSGQPRYEIAKLRNENLVNFHTKADDIIAVAPIIVVYGLDFLGLKAKNDFLNRSAILAKGEIMILGSVYLLKNTINEPRPDGSNMHSFPSGHTAQAFLAATFISQEYHGRIRWMPYAAYTLAASVGALRIANNKHYISDVLVGAGIGILSQKIAYWTHQYRWGRNVKKPICIF